MQDRTRPQEHLECANPRGSPGGWSGLELTDTLVWRLSIKIVPSWLKKETMKFGTKIHPGMEKLNCLGAMQKSMSKPFHRGFLFQSL